MRQNLSLFLGTGFVLALANPFSAVRAQTQPTSASSSLVAQPLSDRTVPFDITATGITKSVLWGLDTAWPNENNLRRGLFFMGASNVGVVRASFQPTLPLVNGDLQQQQIDDLAYRLYLISLTNPATLITLNCDHPSVDAWYLGNAARWAQLIDATTRRVQAAGRTVVSAAPFNEPDYGWGQYTGSAANGQTDFFNICGELRNNPRFANIRLSGGNTLSADAALPWYNAIKTRLDEGNTHQLAGSFNSFASFFQTVRADGKYATDDEMHNVAEAMIGYEYGMQTGIWWGTAELARGEFVKASRGQRLAYAEHRPNWTAASVYRTTDGRVQAFGGTSERQAVTTTYRYLSRERDVYYDGVGPQREYTLVLPGGTGYGNGQTNAERVVNVTWGEDIQPAITSGQYLLVNRATGKVMQVDGGSTTNGANLQQGTYTGAAYQQFNVAPVSTRVGGDFSYFSITAVHSGKAIDDYNFSLDNGGRIAQWDNVVGVNQQRYLDYAEDGYFRIRSRHSSKCLDLAANGVEVVQQEKDANSLSQQWRLLPVGTPIEFAAPGAPSNLTATARPESVRLTWAASPDADVAGYNVLRAEAAAGPFNTIARKVPGTSFVDNTATISKQYFYKVGAVDNSLNRSGYSNQAAATTTGTADLVAQLRFDGSLLDSSPNLNHGAASSSGTSYVAGRAGTNALALNGSTGFVQLPATVANQPEITVATWVYWNGGNNWQRIFDFGNDESQYMFLTPKSGSNTLRFAIKNGGSEQLIETSVLPTGGWSHVAVTLGSTGARMYVNGQQVAQSTSITIRPSDFMPVANYIGRSQYADPLLNGRVDDFNVYNYALSAIEIANLAAVTTTWTGATSTDWNTATNWTNGVPTASTDAVVPANTVRSALVGSGTATMRALTVAGTLTQTGGTLDLRGDLTNNGTLTLTGGTVSLGVAGQANGPGILGSSATRFWNLDVQAGSSALGTAGASVRRVLMLGGTLATQGNAFTLESDATGTGMVVSNGGAVTGNVTVQRYLAAELNAGLGYRHFSAPVGNASVGSLATGSFAPVVNAAYNSSATPLASSPFPTVFSYDQSRLATASNNLGDFDKGWMSPAALTDALAVGRGYTLNLAAGQTLSVTGPLNDGLLVQTLSRNTGATAASAGWALVGNPYPSPLDYAQVAAADRNGLDPAIYVFESTGHYTGSYRANLNGVGGNGSSPNSLLALGQAFFVRVSDGRSSGTLTFRNSQRTTSYQSPAYQRPAETRPLVQLTLQGSGSPLADQAYVYFEKGATDNFEPAFDAAKLPNSTGLNLSTSLTGRQLAIDGRPMLDTTPRVVPLTVGVPATGTYTLAVAQLLNLANVPVYLRDLQTGAVIDLAQQPAYQFAVATAASPLTGRFELVFSPQQALATTPAALAQQVTIYPNPATGSTFLELPASLGRQAVTATLLDAVGREVRTLTLPAQGTAAHQFDLHQLASGVYALRLHTTEGVLVKQLVVK